MLVKGVKGVKGYFASYKKKYFHVSIVIKSYKKFSLIAIDFKTIQTLNQIRKNRHSGGLGWLRVCDLTLNQSINQTLNRVIIAY